VATSTRRRERIQSFTLVIAAAVGWGANTYASSGISTSANATTWNISNAPTCAVAAAPEARMTASAAR